MTGYHITIGYNSALNSAEKRRAFETLKEVVEMVRVQTDRLIAEVERERGTIDHALIREYAAACVPPPQDSTLTVIEPDGDDPGQIMQLASGGGDSRDYKEQLRRAFSRLVILDMHKRGIEVNLVVA